MVRTAINDEAGAKAASFSVDIEQIPGLITKYEEAHEELNRMLLDAQDLKEVVPPGKDEVSDKLANSLKNMAGNEPYKLSWVINQGIDRLQNQIDQLRKSLNEIQERRRGCDPESSVRKNILRRHTAITIAITAALAGAAGCSSNNDSNADPSESNAPAPSSSTEDPQLKIKNPKNLEAVADPCQLLTSEQVSSLGTSAKPEQHESMAGGTRCEWVGPEFIIAVKPNTTIGATDIGKSQDDADNFETARVGEYPAVHIDRQSRLCRVQVGISDKQSFAVNFTRTGAQNPEMMDACAYGDKIASEVLKNIPDA